MFDTTGDVPSGLSPQTLIGPLILTNGFVTGVMLTSWCGSAPMFIAVPGTVGAIVVPEIPMPPATMLLK